jgi:pyruvate/2-oxoglutarate dehydrogenase complex dihydrolipoamide dehydrogenase (E3) component
METSASGSLAGTPVWKTEQNPCYWMKRPSPRFGMVSSEGLLAQTEVPKRLVILGGGIIGCEFASI